MGGWWIAITIVRSDSIAGLSAQVPLKNAPIWENVFNGSRSLSKRLKPLSETHTRFSHLRRSTSHTGAYRIQRQKTGVPLYQETPVYQRFH